MDSIESGNRTVRFVVELCVNEVQSAKLESANTYDVKFVWQDFGELWGIYITIAVNTSLELSDSLSRCESGKFKHV
jgi:hypothetical protein